jgi:hypothetical protein
VHHLALLFLQPLEHVFAIEILDGKERSVERDSDLVEDWVS